MPRCPSHADIVRTGRLGAGFVRRLALIVLVLASAAPRVHGKARHPEAHETVGCSDLIIVGTILAVSPATFTLRVEETLVGTAPTPTLEVTRQRNWLCYRRSREYAVGEREIAFLVRLDAVSAAKTPARYRVYGPGEWSVVGQRVRPEHLVVEGHPFVNHRGIAEQWFMLGDVTAAIRGFRDCFHVGERERMPVREITRTCGEAALAAYSARSTFHAYLVRNTLEAMSQHREWVRRMADQER